MPPYEYASEQDFELFKAAVPAGWRQS
jgi:hypothetical protein